MADDLIPATVIGSWSFPGWYEKFIADVKDHPELFGPADRDEAVRDAVRLAVDDQLRAGLDRITDGEMQRVDFNLGFYEYLRGLGADPAQRGAGVLRPTTSATATVRSRPCQRPMDWGPWPNIAGSANTPMRRSRCPVPGPFTLAGCIDGGDGLRRPRRRDRRPDPDRQRRAQVARRRGGRLHPAR